MLKFWGVNIRGKYSELQIRRVSFNPVALRKAKTVYNFGLSECKSQILTPG